MSNPNRLHVSEGVTNDRGMTAGFGTLIGHRPIHIDGPGHVDHIELKFLHGLRLELERATAVVMARALIEDLAGLPVELNGAEISGAGAQYSTGDDA